MKSPTPTTPTPNSPTRSQLSCTATAGKNDHAGMALDAPKRQRRDVVHLRILVMETRRKLCTLQLPQQTTLARVRSEIVDKNLEKIKSNLYITEEQCRPRLVVIMHRGEECEGPTIYKLAHLGMTNGQSCDLTVRFVRALAFLSKAQINSMAEQVDEQTQSRYPRELTVMAMNMAPKCTFDQTLANLVNHPTRVFEAILQAEDRQIIKEVKAIREQQIFPTCRVRYQIIGEQYRQIILRTFRETMPNVFRHLQQRPHFTDYLMQTGIFTNPDLDRQHHALYDRILLHYLGRYADLCNLGLFPDHETQYSNKLAGSDHERLSLTSQLNGTPLFKEAGKVIAGDVLSSAQSHADQ